MKPKIRNVFFSILLGTLLILLSNSGAMAAKTSSFSISAEVVAEISIAGAPQVLNFGRFVADPDSIETIIMSPEDGARTKSGDIVLLDGPNGIPAEFTLTGAADAYYKVTINSTYVAATLTGPGPAMTVDNWRIFSVRLDSVEDPTGANKAQMKADGTGDTLRVSGTLNVAAAQTPGTYSVAGIPISVEYE